MKITKTDYGALFDKHFPAPEPRKHQKKVAVTSVKKLYEEEKDYVMVDAPPGFGKSIVLYTIMKMAYDINKDEDKTIEDEEFEDRMVAENCENGSFYLTPLKTLQNQLQEDEFIGEQVKQIKGRSNYDCIIENSKVHNAPCQKDKNFKCEVKNQCPYYKRKKEAIEHDQTIMNLSYMMAEGYVPDDLPLSFSNREAVTVDECQSLEDWALGFVDVVFGKYSIPDEVWNSVEIPRDLDEDDIDKVIEWLVEDVMEIVNKQIEHYKDISLLDDDELKTVEELEKFQGKVDRFLEDVEENEWICQIENNIRKKKENYRKLKLKPIKVGRFLDDLVFSRGNKVILSSATIPKGDWEEEIGLEDKDGVRLNIPSNFPVENRKIITNRAIGKMTYNEREQNMPDMVEEIVSISKEHEGEKGFVHCRGYNYIDMFKNTCYNIGYREWFNENCYVQKRESREKSLEKWKNSNKQLFLSVNMAEGVSLDDDLCRFQVLMKTLYPSMADKRIKYRVNQMNDWKWYNGKAVNQIEQAYGRAVRSKDDWADFYVLDESAVNLIKKNGYLFHDWFLNGIVDMNVN